MVIELLRDCDLVRASEVRVYWAGPDGHNGKWQADTFGGSTFTLSEFARTFTEVGTSADLREPNIVFYEGDPSTTTFFSTHPGQGDRPLLPGDDHAFDQVILSKGDANCGLWVRHSITYTLREYPFLE